MNPRCVLIIDDSPVASKILEVTFRREGYRVHSFQDPFLALRTLFVTLALPLPDIAIIDMHLPNMSGYDVVKRLKNHWPRLSVIAISADTSVINRLIARLAGADAFIEKPLKTQEMVALVRRLLGEA